MDSRDLHCRHPHRQCLCGTRFIASDSETAARFGSAAHLRATQRTARYAWSRRVGMRCTRSGGTHLMQHLKPIRRMWTPTAAAAAHPAWSLPTKHAARVAPSCSLSLDTAPKSYRYTQPCYTCARASTALPAQALREKTAQPSRLASVAAVGR